MEWALVGVLNVSLALEDPFDNLGMDGIFIDEQLFEVQQVLEGDYGTLIQEPIAGVPGAAAAPAIKGGDSDGNFDNAQEMMQNVV